MKTCIVIKIEDSQSADSNKAPEELLACRVCLATDLKLYSLHENNLTQTFEDIAGTPVLQSDGLPQHICSMCGMLLLKSSTFRNRCRQTHVFLQDIQVNRPQITSSYLQSIDRKKFSLPLIKTNILALSFDINEGNERVDEEGNERKDEEGNKSKDEEDNEREDDEGNGSKNEVKQEFDLDFCIPDDDFPDKKFSLPLIKTDILALSFDINEGNERVDEEGNEREDEEGNESKDEEDNEREDEEGNEREDEVKQEFNLDFCTSDDDFSDIDGLDQENEDIEYLFVPENEEYSSDESIKSRTEVEDIKVKKKKTVKKSKANKGEQKKEKKKPVKRKRIGNSKTEEDFESFTKMYNVEVLFLTREQQMAELQARKDSEDYIGARLKCEECYKGFMNEDALKTHMARHDPSAGSYVCGICRNRFTHKYYLRKHVRRHDRQFVCKICNVVHKDSTKAKLHHKWHEGFKYECKLCGKNFNNQHTFKNHVRDNHAAIKCDICQQDVSGNRGLAAHKAKVHSGMFKCATCEAQFISEIALARHTELTATGGCDPSISCRSCSQCGEHFLNHQLRSEHMEKEHGDKVYKCEECNTTYSSDRQLGFHWARSHKGRPYKRRRREDKFICEFCAKSYLSEASLRHHLRIHTGEKPFQCQMCPKRFRWKKNLQAHMNTHTGARPYKCTMCPKTFKSLSQRQKHGLLHKNDRQRKWHNKNKKNKMAEQ